MTQFWDGSAIRLGNEGTLYTPSYYVLQMYSAYRGQMKVKAALSSPAFSNIAIGNTPAMSNVPYLDTLVTKSLDGSKLYISIINRNETSGYSLPITINGAIVGSEAIVRQVAADNYLDANTWDEPDKISMQSSTISAGNTFTFSVPKLSVTVIELSVSGLTSITNPVLCGKVKDTNGSPVADATVVTSNGMQTTTNSDGYYEIAITEGHYWIEVSKTGYTTERMNNVYVYAGAGTMAQPIIIG